MKSINLIYTGMLLTEVSIYNFLLFESVKSLSGCFVGNVGDTPITETEQAAAAISEEATTQKEIETTEIPQTTETKTHSAKAITETEQAAAAISEQATTQKETETTDTNKKKGQKAKSSPK